MVSWGSLAEICKQYLKKGQQVYIEGRLQTRKWEDDDGNRRSSVEIVAKEMIMLGERKKKTTQNGESFEDIDSFDASELPVEEDEFPF